MNLIFFWILSMPTLLFWMKILFSEWKFQASKEQWYQSSSDLHCFHTQVWMWECFPVFFTTLSPLSYGKHGFWKLKKRNLRRLQVLWNVPKKNLGKKGGSFLNSRKAGSWDPSQLIPKYHLLQFLLSPWNQMNDRLIFLGSCNS